MNTNSTLAPDGATFDPAFWLASFAEVGGVYCLTPDGGLYIGWLNPEHGGDNQRLAAAMKRELTAEQYKAIAAYLTGDTHGPNHAIEQAWQAYKQGRRGLDAIHEDYDERVEGPAKRLWAIMDGAEEAIHLADAKTMRGLEIKLWIALSHCVTYVADDQAFQKEDLPALIARAEELDWNGRVLVGAIKSLRAMEA